MANSYGVILWSILAQLFARGFDVFDVHPQRWFIAFVILIILLIVMQPYLYAINRLSTVVRSIYFGLNVIFVGSFVFITVYYFVGQKDRMQAKADRLLLNILPQEIAAILKNEKRTIAQSYDEVSILFADIVDFTPMSATLSPEELVELLNDVFSYFDGLVDKYGLEKIKTIGDCYMVAASVPRPCSDHA